MEEGGRAWAPWVDAADVRGLSSDDDILVFDLLGSSTPAPAGLQVRPCRGATDDGMGILRDGNWT